MIIEGRTIANTFWGKAWCENLERYSDFSNRLPRGRTYVRNGSVVDLQIAPGVIRAYVSGSSLYEVELKIVPVAKAHWKSICNDCSGAVDSLVGAAARAIVQSGDGANLPSAARIVSIPAEIRLSCSCPDWADMCKHVAAVLYGIGARFDHQPELLFRLRGVDETELIASAGHGIPLAKQGPLRARFLAAMIFRSSASTWRRPRVRKSRLALRKQSGTGNARQQRRLPRSSAQNGLRQSRSSFVKILPIWN